MEHLHHFGLTQDPFQNEPDLRFFFESARHVEAQRRVERGVRGSKGLCVLTGEPGTGKTLLARRLFEGLEEELFEANLMVMVAGRAGAGSLLRRFAAQLEVDSPAAEDGVLLGQVVEALSVVREDGRHAVLIIDDAQLLCADAMAEVGALLNLEYEDRRLVSILLVGDPALDVALGRESSLVQRVDVRMQLEALSLDDSTAYLAHRIGTVGGNPEILSPEAVAALHKYGRGRPRLMNTLADNALFEAFLAGRRPLTANEVERAAGDLRVGEDPGTTFTAAVSAPAQTATPVTSPQPAPHVSPAAGPATSVGSDTNDVLGELTDPNANDAMDTSGATVVMSAGSDEGTLALENPAPANGAANAELTTLLPQEDAGAAGVLDLDDSLLEIPIDDPTGLPNFAAQNTGAPEAEATRLAFPDEDASSDNDEIDDLFVELLDD